MEASGAGLAKSLTNGLRSEVEDLLDFWFYEKLGDQRLEKPAGDGVPKVIVHHGPTIVLAKSVLMLPQAIRTLLLNIDESSIRFPRRDFGEPSKGNTHQLEAIPN